MRRCRPGAHVLDMVPPEYSTRCLVCGVDAEAEADAIYTAQLAAAVQRSVA